MSVSGNKSLISLLVLIYMSVCLNRHLAEPNFIVILTVGPLFVYFVFLSEIYENDIRLIMNLVQVRSKK